MIFEIQQDKETVNSCGFVVENPKFSLEDKVELISYTRIIPFSIHRIDVNYLSSRTSFHQTRLQINQFC